TVNSIKSELDEFADWILSYVPEPIKKTAKEAVDKRVKRLKERIKRLHGEAEDRFTPKEQKTALKGYLKTYGIAGQEGYGPKEFITKIRPKVIKLVNDRKKPIKVKFVFTCRYIKEDLATGQIEEELGYHHTEKPEIVTESTDFSDLFNVMTNPLIGLVEKFQKQGSGWQFDRVEYFDINIDPFDPLSGSSYVELPKELAVKKAIINVRNENDHKCFKWAVTSAVYPKRDNPQRLSRKMMENSERFDWSGIEFPVSLRQIDKFERQNPHTVNVFTYEEKKICPLRISGKDPFNAINLLLISNGETSHYCWIKDVMSLVSSQIDKYHHTRFLCFRCLNSFRCEMALEKHYEYCSKNESVRIEMPMDKDGKPLYTRFVNFNRKMRVPFVVYADFESFTENIDTCSPDESRSFTKQYQKHKPSGFCYLIKCIDDGVFSPKLVQRTVQGSAEDVAQLFVESLESDIKEIYNKFKFPKENLGTSEGKINCIPNNEEKYISFTKQVVVDRFTNKEGKQVDVKRDIRFIDSFKFMSASLDSLVKNLPRESFKNLTTYYEGEQLQLLLRKGVFPYDCLCKRILSVHAHRHYRRRTLCIASFFYYDDISGYPGSLVSRGVSSDHPRGTSLVARTAIQAGAALQETCTLLVMGSLIVPISQLYTPSDGFTHSTYITYRDVTGRADGNSGRGGVTGNDLARLMIWVLRDYNEIDPIILSALPNLPGILRNLQPVLESSSRCRGAIGRVPMVTYRKPRSLKDMLVHSSLKEDSTQVRGCAKFVIFKESALGIAGLYFLA
ncbi:predicted protein, partial [Nematostella vectensis]